METRDVRIALFWALGLAACAAASFLLLDRQTHETVYGLAQQAPVYTSVEVLVTFGKAGYLLLALAALWLAGWKTGSLALRRAAALGAAAQAVTGALVWAVKLSIPRERPYVPFHLKGAMETSYYRSFPSADAAAVFAFAFALALPFPRARPALMGFAAAVAAMRVFRMAHYPSDVFAGAAAGAAGWAATLALAALLKARSERRAPAD